MKLRHRSFFDVDELNDAIASLLDAYNHKSIRRKGSCRSVPILSGVIDPVWPY
jgi:hypothetical protein